MSRAVQHQFQRTGQFSETCVFRSLAWRIDTQKAQLGQALWPGLGEASVALGLQRKERVVVRVVVRARGCRE